MERVNPAATEEGVPAELVALQAAYALAEKGNEGVAALLTVALCGGVCVSTHRGLAQFASYNAACKCSRSLNDSSPHKNGAQTGWPLSSPRRRCSL